MVSVGAFQAVDPGSIPGRRSSLFLSFYILFSISVFYLILLFSQQPLSISSFKICNNTVTLAPNYVLETL